jgi:hypothetical protein
MPIEMPPEKRFIFNGSAVAFAGRIRRPDDHFIKAAAPSHLPVTGGLSESHLEGPGIEEYHYKDFITFKLAHSRAQGDFSDPKQAVAYTHGNHGQNDLRADTTVETRLEGFRIDAPPDPDHNTPRRVFEAKTLHVYTASSSNRRDPISFHALTATFEGITLTTGTSAPVELKVHTATEVFCQNDTKAKLIATYAADGEFRKKYAACFHPIGANLPGFLGNLLGMGKHGIPNAEKGPIVATFVTGVEWVGGDKPDGTEALNNRLTIPGLGRIYFGEIVVEENSRRATLLRFELGSKHGGDGTAGECVTNGSNTEGT